jgi:hypothetical protein
VAVYITGSGDVGIKKVLGDQLTVAIAKRGKYIAIERTSSFLTELSKEQKYQRAGAVIILGEFGTSYCSTNLPKKTKDVRAVAVCVRSMEK